MQLRKGKNQMTDFSNEYYFNLLLLFWNDDAWFLIIIIFFYRFLFDQGSVYIFLHLELFSSPNFDLLSL